MNLKQWLKRQREREKAEKKAEKKTERWIIGVLHLPFPEGKIYFTKLFPAEVAKSWLETPPNNIGQNAITAVTATHEPLGHRGNVDIFLFSEGTMALVCNKCYWRLLVPQEAHTLENLAQHLRKKINGASLGIKLQFNSQIAHALS